MKIIDISLPLNNKTPIYPGNISVSVNNYNKIPEYMTAVSSITLGSHTGTHIDAPSHAILGAPTLDQISLERFIGPCRVLDFSTEKEEAITTPMLEGKNIQNGERLLLKTRNSVQGFNEFYEDYVYLDGDAAEYLANKGTLLVGIDALSIKKRRGKDHRPHISLLEKNVAIVEGLDLSSVEEGVFELFCLPLKFTEIDGAPARAILIEK